MRTLEVATGVWAVATLIVLFFAGTAAAHTGSSRWTRELQGPTARAAPAEAAADASDAFANQDRQAAREYTFHVDVTGGESGECRFVATITTRPISRDDLIATPAFARLPHVVTVEGRSVKEIGARLAARSCRKAGSQ